MLAWESPYQGALEVYGKDFGDLMQEPSSGLLMTEHFAEAFKAESLTGLGGFQPMEILRVRRKRRGPKLGPPPRYLYVLPAYGQPALDMNCGRILLQKPMRCT